MAKRVLITGCSGLIGRELCKQLSDMGYYTVGVDNESRFKDFAPSCLDAYYQLDIEEFVKKIPNNFDYIYHYAAINGTKSFYSNPTKVLINNTNVDLTMFSYASSNKRKSCKFIYASSSEVVSGTTNYPTSEELDLYIKDVTNPRWSYRLPKVMTENLLFNSDINFVIFRYFNVYSEHSGKGHFVKDIIDKIKNQDFNLISPDETRSFCYVQDAVSATIQCAEMVDNDIINIGSDEEITVQTATKILSNALGYQGDWNEVPSMQGSTKRRRPNLQKLKKYIPNYTPEKFLTVIEKIKDKL
jgi:UDP-glucose 4-epimerase